MDHRCGRRHRSLFLVKVHFNHRTEPGLVYNSCRQGLYVLSKIPVSKGQYVEIVTTDFSNQEMVNIAGVVVHRNKYGFGLMFCEPDKSTSRFIQQVSNRWDTVQQSVV